MDVKNNWPLQRYTTFGVDVDARFYAEAETEEELVSLLQDARYAQGPKLILGGGSNILFLDDFPGLVIRPVNRTLKAEVRGNKVLLRVGAGCVWDQVVRYTVYRAWWGLENMAGIPGSVGGAAVQNMGAYGAEIQDCVVSVTAIRKTDGQRVVFTKEECAYGYRTSLFKRKDSPYVVWDVLLELSLNRGPLLSYEALSAKWPAEELAEITPADMMREVLRMRKQKLPDPKVLGSAGSFFANPVVPALHYERVKAEYADLPGHPVEQGVKIPAARLIEQCGWKGYREGDAGVYEGQPLVLVNYGMASGAEIWELACRIRDSVEKKFDIRLQTEVCLYGTEEDKRQMHYQAVLDKMFHSLPMFQRIGAAAYKADLSNTLKMMEALNNPHQRFKSVHVAGTNGKGSCSHLLAAIFQAAGYKTGLYTSPHLNDFRERIRINGEMIPQERVIAFYETNAAMFDRIKASFFEMTVAMAFDYFAQERVEIAVIEVGMGGRLDSTNVITPELSLITNISPDHMQVLGDTLAKIAEEKAGIIKPGVPVVIGETQVQTLPVFQKKAAKCDSPIVFADGVYGIELKGETADGLQVDVSKQGNLYVADLVCALRGASYQLKNIVTVMAAVDILKGKYAIGETDIRNGFRQVLETTGLRGRWQQLGHKPDIFADTGHNEGGVALVMEMIEKRKFKHLRIVWGMVSDKDISHVMALLPKDATYYFCAADIERALPAKDMAAQGAAFSLQGKAYASVWAALQAAKAEADPDDLIYVGGSTFVVAEVL